MTQTSTTTTATTYERVEAGDVRVGDRVARTRKAPFHEVADIDQGSTTVRFHYADHGGTDRPRRIALWWREVRRTDRDEVLQRAREELAGSQGIEPSDVDLTSEGPGRYEGADDVELAVALDVLGLVGSFDEQVGEVDTIGHHGRIGRFVLVTDSAGFQVVTTYETEAEAVAYLASLVEADEDEELPTGCAHCLDRIAGRTRALCPSHGDEWEA